MDESKELVKALREKGLSGARKYYPSNRREAIVGVKWVLKFSIGPVLLILLSNYRLIQIAVAIVFILYFVRTLLEHAFNMYYQGMLHGARRALENPPPIGETYLEITEAGEQIWKSEKINFQPKHEPKQGSLKLNPRASYPDPQKRREIVEHYRRDVKAGVVANKIGWAQSNYGISGRPCQ